MLNQFSRTELIYGHEAMEKLKNSRVAIFGIGGVGSSGASGPDYLLADRRFVAGRHGSAGLFRKSRNL